MVYVMKQSIDST